MINNKQNLKIGIFYKVKFLFRWWWVVLFVFLVSLLYKQGVHAKSAVHQSLIDRKFDLERQKVDAMQQKEELLLKLSSQNDPRWVEMTLMKGLGVVPEGQTKVLFVEKR
jgi:hypothetical protein